MTAAAAVILAAGMGTRFGPDAGAKLMADCGGEPVVARAISSAMASGLPVFLVHGALDLDAVARDLGATPVYNDRFAEGISTSLQAGVGAARAAGFDVVVVGLGDQPGVPPRTWAELAATDAPLAVATYAGRRGNPVRLHSDVWPDLPVSGDEGARGLLRTRHALVVEVPSGGTPADVDTMSDLDNWNS